MKHGSLFSGIGGFDLAAEWMGWENVFHCEWNPFGQKVLKYYWPNSESFNDITKTDFTKYANRIDVLSGGFPCQPYSVAGKQKGKEDERHLWPEMRRAIMEISPRFIVGENVRGLTYWGGGMVFEEVCVEMENLGYQVAPFIVPACGVGAIHRRDRIWFVAHANNTNGNYQSDEIQKADGKISEWFNDPESYNTIGDSEIWRRLCFGNEQKKPNDKIEQWENVAIENAFCDGDNGISGGLDGITFPQWYNESIKAAGNAIVPQVALSIFKAIEQYELLTAPATDTRQSS
jgi:DNA (cytosine-5)-methyltransferase 1